MSGIFISYRREDSAGWAGRINDHLKARLGVERVFMDIIDIPIGSDFTQIIDQTIAQVSAVVVVIGPGWLSAIDEEGSLRIADPEDFVHREVASSLERGVMVIPVLVNGAEMPKAGDLPEALRSLAMRNAVVVTDTHFRHDIDRLLAAVEPLIDAPEPTAEMPAPAPTPPPPAAPARRAPDPPDPPDPSPPPPAEPEERKSLPPAALIGGAAAIVALLVITLVFLTRGDSAPAAAPTTTTTSSATTTTTAPTSTTTTQPPPALTAPLPVADVLVGGHYLEAGPGCPGAGAYPAEERYHLGVDLVSPVGTPVLAIADGTVIRVSASGWGPGNHALIVRHRHPEDGSRFVVVYGNMSASWAGSPGEGDDLFEGQQIGAIGFPEYEPEPFLHLGIHLGPADIESAGGYGVGQADCDLWVDADGDGLPDGEGGFVDPLEFLGIEAGG